VSRFVGILPDGLCLDFAAGIRARRRPIGCTFPPAQPVLEVFLAVPQGARWVPRSRGRGRGLQPPAAEEAVSDATRFRGGHPAGGRHDRGVGRTMPIAFARRNVSLLSAMKPGTISTHQDCRDRAQRPAARSSRAKPSFPSVLSISASFVPGQQRAPAARVTIAKQRQLSEERRQRDAVTVEFGTGEVTRFLQLSAPRRGHSHSRTRRPRR